MDYTMKNATNSNKGMMDKLFDVDWQIDSEWINVSSTIRSATPARSKKGKQTKHKTSFEADILPDYHFVPTRKGGRFLIIDNQAFRMSQKQASGHIHWVCSIPSCTAWCVLTPDVKKIVRICKDHNHDMKVNRQEYRSFITALKESVNETPHIKPKDLYDAELEKLRKKWSENTNSCTTTEEPYLPSFEAVSVAMHNSRNAVLSAVSLKAAGEQVEASEVVSVQYPIPSRSTRSRVSPREKLASSSTILSHSSGSADLLDEEWCSVSNKNANLSDLEDWLEDDGTAMVGVSPSKPQGKSLFRKTPTKENQELKLGLSNNEEDGHWDNVSGLESIPRRKYRKRPASSSVFTCPHCPYKSNRHFNVQRHERLAHSTKKPEFNCKECGTSYSLEYRLKLHIKAVHQGEGHHCHVCSRTFETMTGLKSHIVTKHKNDDPKIHREPPPELTCKLCGRVFSTKSHLQKHTSTHVMIQPYRCCTCNKPFMEEVTWLSHQSSCSDAFTVQCCLCSAFISTAEDLMSHMDVVHGRSEYSCYCGKSFPWKKSLLTHQQKCSLFLAERSM